MSRSVYFIALAIVSISVSAQLAAVIASWFGLWLQLGPLSMLSRVFASPVPAPLQAMLPALVKLPLLVAFTALVIRRLWLLRRVRPLAPPSSFTTWPSRLLVVAVASFLLLVVGLLLSIAIRAGSGVPAAFLGFPAFILLTPVLFYVEVRSLPWFAAQSASPLESGT